MTLAAYSVLVLLFIMSLSALINAHNKRRVARFAQTHDPIAQAPPVSDKSEREERFTRLVTDITPTWFWRINHEYSDFINATIKKMSNGQIIAIPGLFEAQRRCSLLNAAVYHYYANLKKRCLDGEQIHTSDIEVVNMRHCFDEFILQAYPALVALVWPELQRPQLSLAPPE